MNNKRIKTALQFSRAVLLFYKPLEQNVSNFPSYWLNLQLFTYPIESPYDNTQSYEHQN